MQTPKSPTGRLVESKPNLQDFRVVSPEAQRVIDAFQPAYPGTVALQPKAP